MKAKKYYTALIYRHGRGLDYGCLPRETRAEAERDLAECLAMMTDREATQSAVESYVVSYSLTAEEYAEIMAAGGAQC